MTQTELDALPELGGFDTKIMIRDGREVRVPYMKPTLALFHKPDDPIDIIGNDGQRYMVGWANGIRYKSKRPRL